jgi:hypothetical protein
MAERNGVVFLRVLASAERRSEAAILTGSFQVNTPGSRSRALLVSFTCRDQCSIRSSGTPPPGPRRSHP